MSIERIDPVRPDTSLISRAANILREGRLVAFPTETVYGLGANALDARAVERIYNAKGRPAYNPLIVHVADPSLVDRVASKWDARAQALADAFWPGPLTLVLPKRPEIPDSVTAGLPSVGVRVPRHPVAQALLAAAGIPVAAPSANRSNELSPTTGAHVHKSLGDAVDLILDAGPTSVGIESTVLDLGGAIPTVLRPGTITLDELARVVGRVASAAKTSGDAARPSPGMLDRHYSPRARLILAERDDVGIRVEQERARAQRVGAMVIRADVEPSSSVVRMSDEPLGYAARLYDALHALDDAACDVIVVERVPDAPEWLGVADRLRRAAT